MKRLGGIWPRLIAFDNLLLAYRRARRGKGRRLDVQTFSLDLERHLLTLQRVPAYLRYVDDLYLLGDDLGRLWAWRDACGEYLASLRLLLHPRKARVQRTSEAVDILGYRISRQRRWLRNDNGYRFQRRFRRRLALYRAGRLAWSDLIPGVQSWIGHAGHAETAGLRTTLFGPVAFDPQGWYIL